MRTALTLIVIAALTMLSFGLSSGCKSAPRTASEVAQLEHDARLQSERARRLDPSLERFFEDSYGYVVFPTVTKGGLIAGGAHGHGVEYQNEEGNRDEAIGTAELTAATFGLQAGGQSYTEIIFFQRKIDLLDFCAGNLEFGAQATAVAVDNGAGANADYDKGVAIFTMGERGLMAEASLGGQKFEFTRKKKGE